MKVFNELQIDILKEFINVAFGTATANIAELLEAFATLHTPKIEVIEANHLDEYISNLTSPTEKKYQAQQIFNGEISGETVFLINEDSIQRLAKHFYGKEVSEAYLKDSILELNNILSVTTIGKLSELTDLESEFIHPTLKIIEDENYIEKEEKEKYPSVITISTVLDFEDEEIIGFLFILSTEEMIETLRNKIDSIIKEDFPEYGN